MKMHSDDVRRPESLCCLIDRWSHTYTFHFRCHSL